MFAVSMRRIVVVITKLTCRPKCLGTGQGFTIRMEVELERALHATKANTYSFSLLDVPLPPGDVSDNLQRLRTRLGKAVRG
jgi:DNA-binding response OmpR family regulator